MKIIDFFKKTNEVATPSKSVTDKELVAEIHETFFTEVDRLLEEARVMKPTETIKGDLIEKRSRLISLGFNQTKEVREAESEVLRLNEIEYENERRASLVEAINYFSSKYPNYKFITEKSVKAICDKYGLVYGPVSKYRGMVPDVNLKHIENFKIDDTDKCYESYYEAISIYGMSSDRYGYYATSSLDDMNKMSESREHSPTPLVTHHLNNMPLEIAAPATDFDFSRSEIKDLRVIDKPMPDPVVLQPVYFSGNKHYLIVTAWGPEADDVDVINEKMN